ncbi:P-loop NTPase fold protein [Roseateles noduli]|uniref:P-loop NTPase fold protein n=1 Tax=Roseateles noduli TaxID=2052484 RepID=UPI003D64C850
MSIDITRQRLDAVFADATPKVLLLTGGWGEGKTHQWREAVARANPAKTKLKFAYLSLFGVGSLADMRRRLSEELVASISVPGEATTLGQQVAELAAGRKYLQAAKLLPLIPIIGKADALLNELSFSAVRNAVICIDDLERKGAGLSIADVYGLASFLKEERSCRVVLVANDAKLQGVDTTTAQTFMEKVVDEQVHFSPTVQEACQIALGTSPDKAGLLLQARMLNLGIANIRVIKRLKRLVDQMAVTVAGLDPQLLEIGVLAVAIFGLGHLVPDGRFPSIEFTLKRVDAGWIRYALQAAHGKQPPTEEEKKEARWEELLETVGGPSNSSFEQLLAEAVQKGYLSTDLRKHAEQLSENLGQRALAEGYRSAWMGFWHSLEGTGAPLLDRLFQTTIAAVGAIGPGDLRNAYDAFESAGRGGEALQLVDAFIQAHKNHPRIFDRNFAAFPEHFSGAFGEKFSEAAAKYTQQPTTEEVLNRLDVNAWNPEDASIVAKAPRAELEALVRGASGTTFRSRIRVLLQLGSMNAKDPKTAETSKWFASLLQEWAAADPVTAIRLKQYLPPPAAPAMGANLDLGGVAGVQGG